MLKRIRRLAAFLCFIAVTLLFLDFTGATHQWLGFLAKVQFIPAVLAVNLVPVLFVVLLTALFGRLYCSVICPLGVMQDGIARIGKKAKKKKKRPYSYSKPKTWLRYTFLVIFLGAAIAHVGSIAAFLDPYAIYGRIANTLLLPIWQAGNNLLALLAERMDSYTFYQTEVWIKSLPTLLVAVVSLLVVGVLSFRNGRTYCNTICPVGTMLGRISRYALYRIQINNSCNGCMRCASNCKSACINIKEKSVDHSRCVACFNCLSKCKRGSIQYKWSLGKAGDLASLIPVANSGLTTHSTMQDSNGSAVKPTTDCINPTTKQTTKQTMETTQGKLTQGKLTEQKITEGKLAKERLTEGKITQQKKTEEKLTKERLTEGKITQQKITEGKLAKERLTQQKTTENKEGSQNNLEKNLQAAGEKMSTGRRNFIATSALLAVAGIKAQVPKGEIADKVDGGFAEILDKKIPQRQTAITPPGSISARNMKKHCTACQLCVTACPNQVLRPSNKLGNFMQPEMSYERGYCRPECNKCSQVCPAGAIKPLSTDDKSATQIGYAVWNRELCIPLVNGDGCGNCARHCPTGAISMVASGERTPKVPAVDVERCIGCGACEQVCPSRPYSAIYVEGHKLHKTI